VLSRDFILHPFCLRGLSNSLSLHGLKQGDAPPPAASQFSSTISNKRIKWPESSASFYW